MGYAGDKLGRAASESLGLLKQVTNFSRARIDDAAPIVPQQTAPQAAETLVIRTSAPVAVPANDPTVISVNVEMSGTIVSPDELHVAGKIEGNVRAASLIVRASGSITGDIAADSVVVHGMIEGRIFAQKVQLAAGATVRGDIVHGQLGIDPNALFEGASRRSQNALADAPQFSAFSKPAA